jgi:molybdopterin molybdotransferase
VAELISIEAARQLVLEAVRPLEQEDVALADALGRVLAGDVASPTHVPPFDNSAMDGFAVQAGTQAELDVVGSSRAGHPAREGVGPGTTVRISTGAAVPEGATAVVPIERARPVDGTDGRIWVEASTDGDNIRRAGEDVRAGDVVLHRGAVLGPAELGVAAAIGRASLPCARVPRVAVLVTGDELTDPGEDLGPGGIYSSNSFALAALAKRSGARLSGQVTVGDSADSTRDSIRSALEDADVICVSGGMSVGPHDYVKPALADLGVTEHFWGVALRPGKPTWFGSLDRRLVFGLPGNPVSAMVAFYLFVRPALAVLQGAPAGLSRVSAVLDDPVRLLAAREQAVRVRLFARDDGWHAAMTGPQGSHMLTSMLGAGGLAMVGPGEGEAPPGTRVEVELL